MTFFDKAAAIKASTVSAKSKRRALRSLGVEAIEASKEAVMAQTRATYPEMSDNVKKRVVTKPPTRKAKKTKSPRSRKSTRRG
jgi:hypothetical protein